MCVCVAVHLQLEASHGTVGSNQCHLLFHVVLAAVVQSLEVLSQSFGVLALLKEVVALLLQLIKQELKMRKNFDMIKCAAITRTENKLAQTITDQEMLSINQGHVYFF